MMLNTDYSELYAEQHGADVLKPIRVPECGCPRPYIDEFNLIASQIIQPSRRRRNVNSDSGRYCYNLFDQRGSQAPRYNVPYYILPDKLAIFSEESQWMSDLTTRADITMRLPQDMLVRLTQDHFLPSLLYQIRKERSLYC